MNNSSKPAAESIVWEARAPSKSQPLLRVYATVFAVYLAMGPVYWFPGVGALPFTLVKAALFFALVLVPPCTFALGRRLHFPGGSSLFFILLSLLAWSILNGAYGEASQVLYRVQNFVQIMLFLWACGFLYDTGYVFQTTKLAVKLFFFIVFVWCVMAFLMPNAPSPLNEGLPLYRTGFGGTWVDWGPAIALYLPWLYSISLFKRRFVIPAIAAGLFSQISGASRAAFLATVSSFLVFSVQRVTVKKFFVIFAISLVGIYFVATNLEELRLAAGSLTSLEGLNQLSTNRLDGYLAGLATVAENPFFGAGINQVGAPEGVHNLFLKAAAEGGLPYMAGLVALYSFILLKVRRLRARPGNSWGFRNAAMLSVIAGMTAAMFAPAYTIGQFNTTVFWWFCVAICVRNAVDFESAMTAGKDT